MPKWLNRLTCCKVCGLWWNHVLAVEPGSTGACLPPTVNCSTCRLHTHTHTHPFNGPLSGTTQVSQYQKGKTNLDFTEARVSEWQWHQLGHMQVCTSLQTVNHASTSPLEFFTGRMLFLPPSQQRQSTEGKAQVDYRSVYCRCIVFNSTNFSV